MSKGCGICGIYPKWLRDRATPKNFIAVYGLLGTVQAMAFIYIVVTLTTLEKRFKIPSRTTGLILSGNEISQILSLILTYYGGSGHRPRWIAVGVGLSALSCLVLALPHFLYGPGRDALALTKEYLDQTLLNATSVPEDLAICPRVNKPERCDEEALMDVSILPRLLVFLSQFILGIGTTLYYGLGQTYLDDNTKKKNTPMLLGFTFALRTVGPAIGFFLGYGCLSLYIDPSLHPVITKKDPRWLGAWWLGWIILGVTMGMFAVLIAMFPRDLPDATNTTKDAAKTDGTVPLKIELVLQEKCSHQMEPRRSLVENEYIPTMKEFPKAMKRLLTNWLLTCNNLSGVFYVLGASAYITFLAKYLEVQYSTSAAGGTVIAGPISLVGMVLGFLLSGLVISKFKPGPRPLLAWNVFVGLCFVAGQISFIFLGCSDAGIKGLDLQTMQMNLQSSCNEQCNCEGVKYSPVCHEASTTTYFSACHAGCRTIIDDKEFGNCSCLRSIAADIYGTSVYEGKSLLDDHSIYPSGMETQQQADKVRAGPCVADCNGPYLLFTILTCIIQTLACSGKIGNVLVNYRSVEKRDKSFAQGVTLMIISLFALIPGPIIYGAIIDSTCLIWEESCGTRGNCWFHHRENFRYMVNITSAGFSIIGVFFDAAVCYLGKDLDLYGAQESDKRREFIKEDSTTPNADAERKKEANGSVNQRIDHV